MLKVYITQMQGVLKIPAYYSVPIFIWYVRIMQNFDQTNCLYVMIQ